MGCGMAGCMCAMGLAWWAFTDMPSMSLARPEASRAGSRSALREGAGMSDEGGGIQIGGHCGRGPKLDTFVQLLENMAQV